MIFIIFRGFKFTAPHCYRQVNIIINNNCHYILLTTATACSLIKNVVPWTLNISSRFNLIKYIQRLPIVFSRSIANTTLHAGRRGSHLKQADNNRRDLKQFWAAGETRRVCKVIGSYQGGDKLLRKDIEDQLA